MRTAPKYRDEEGGIRPELTFKTVATEASADPEEELGRPFRITPH